MINQISLKNTVFSILLITCIYTISSCSSHSGLYIFGDTGSCTHLKRNYIIAVEELDKLSLEYEGKKQEGNLSEEATAMYEESILDMKFHADGLGFQWKECMSQEKKGYFFK